jgi:hypothetical protein
MQVPHINIKITVELDCFGGICNGLKDRAIHHEVFQDELLRSSNEVG